MTEARMRQAVVAALKGRDAVAVENPIRPGTPDVNYIEGWIELKQIPAWPKRADTPVRIDHFTPQQRVWLHRRCLRGGRAHVLLLVGNKEWLLFQGEDAANHLGKIPKKQLLSLAIAVHLGSLDRDWLLKHLT